MKHPNEKLSTFALLEFAAECAVDFVEKGGVKPGAAMPVTKYMKHAAGYEWYTDKELFAYVEVFRAEAKRLLMEKAVKECLT